MLKQYDTQTARQTILKRTPPDEFPISQRVLDNIAKLFGESLTAEQAVTRILKDVRANGDSALREWTQRLDAMDLKPAPVRRQPSSLRWTRSRPFSVMRLRKLRRALKHFTVTNL